MAVRVFMSPPFTVHQCYKQRMPGKVQGWMQPCLPFPGGRAGTRLSGEEQLSGDEPKGGEIQRQA